VLMKLSFESYHLYVLHLHHSVVLMIGTAAVSAAEHVLLDNNLAALVLGGFDDGESTVAAVAVAAVADS